MTPKVGDIYVGWGKRWIVTRVFADCPPDGGDVVEACCVDDPSNTVRLPVTQFVQGYGKGK